MTTPTLINLPPPPSDPVTPSGPGTPNSTTTSLSALSTTAIKDGHQGHPLHHTHAHLPSSGSITSTTTLEAERADRISRLAGLERVATARAGGTPQHPTFPSAYPPGYFDIKERSTVGSASATGSVGARTTWASGSDIFDIDKMSEGPDDGASSIDNVSDEGDASLVGFGEGSSTISGPTSHHPGLRVSPYGRPGSFGSPSRARNPLASPPQTYSPDESTAPATLMPTASSTFEPGQDTRMRTPLYPPADDEPGVVSTGSTPPASTHDARMVDGMTYDPDVVDTTVRTPRLATPSYSGNDQH